MVIHAKNRCGRNSSTNTAVASVDFASAFTSFTVLASLSIGASMAAHTVVQIAASLIAVLTKNVLHRVLLAAIAGIAAVIYANVASDALRAVILAQRK